MPLIKNENYDEATRILNIIYHGERVRFKGYKEIESLINRLSNFRRYHGNNMKFKLM